MGLEFALVHDATHEAYDLGKWCGDPEWRTTGPTTRAEVLGYFVEFFEGGEDTREWAGYADAVADVVWAFVESHPGCRLVDEHDYVWRREPTDEDRRIFGPDYVFREVGSRYDVKPKDGQDGVQAVVDHVVSALRHGEEQGK